MTAKAKTPPRKRMAKDSKAMPTTALADISLRDDFLLGTAEAARRVGLSPKTLRQMRCERTGPRCLKLGTGKQARVAYRRSDLEAWVMSQVTAVHGA